MDGIYPRQQLHHTRSIMKRALAFPALVSKRPKVNIDWPTSGTTLQPLHDPYTGNSGTVGSISNRSGYKSLDALHYSIRADQPFSTPTTAGIIVPIWIDSLSLGSDALQKGTILTLGVNPQSPAKNAIRTTKRVSYTAYAAITEHSTRLCAITAEHTRRSTNSSVTSVAVVIANTTELANLPFHDMTEGVVKAGTIVYVIADPTTGLHATTHATKVSASCLFSCRMVLDAHVRKGIIVRPLVHISTFYS